MAGGTTAFQSTSAILVSGIGPVVLATTTGCVGVSGEEPTSSLPVCKVATLSADSVARPAPSGTFK